MKNAGLIIGIALIVVLVILLLGIAGMMGVGGFGMMGPGMMGPGMMGGQGFGGGGMLLGGLVMLLFWGLVIAGLVWLVVTLARSGQTPAGAPIGGRTPLDILKERYAKGEITKDQFEEIKRDLA